MTNSDDFSGGGFDPAVWRVEGPSGTSAGTGTRGADGFARLVTAAGDHDVYDTNNGARLMQDAPDEDFQIAARWLSMPAKRYQLQGFLIEEDADNWIRLDIYSDGTKLRAFGAVTTDGDSTTKFNVTLASDMPWMRLTRAGDSWTFELSADGVTWSLSRSFTHAMEVSALGLLSGSSGASGEFTAEADWFGIASDPIINEDGSLTPLNAAPIATDDAAQTLADTAVTLSPLANDSDPDGDPLSLAAFTQPGSGSLVQGPGGTLVYTPNPGFSGTDSFTYTLSDGALTDTATVTIGVAAPGEVALVVSDDFSGGGFDPAVWRVEGPSGTSAGTGTRGADGFARLVTAAGDHDVYDTNNGARLMQDAPDEDFQIAARWLSMPAKRYQLQGFLIEEDADNWIRLDIYSDGTKLRAFGAVTTDGDSTTKFNVTLASDMPWMRLTRAGDSWTFELSADGVTWSLSRSFTHAMEVSALGLLSGSSGASGGFTAEADWFGIASDPIIDEDGSLTPLNAAPIATDDAAQTLADTAVTLSPLANDSDPDGDPLSLAAFTQPGSGSLVQGPGGTLVYTPNPGFSGTDSFTYTLSDGALTDTATVTIGVAAPGEVALVVSDDFSGGGFDPAVWRVEGPSGTSAGTGTRGADGFARLVTAAGDHDVYDTNNGARLMQDAPDEDFQIAARWLSMPAKRYQLQGFLIEEDADNWIRLDIYSDGTKLRAFGAVTTDGDSTTKFNVTLASDMPWMRLTRAGDSWTFELSADGVTWSLSRSFTHTMEVSALGLLSGSSGASGGFTAEADWFGIASDPIIDEDGSLTPLNAAPIATDDAAQTLADTAVTLSPLANDSDPDGDPLSLAAFTQPGSGSLVQGPGGTLVYTPNPGFSGTDSFTYTISDGALTDTATVTIGVGEPINIWHGDTQTFGAPGAAQRWVNILGNVYTADLLSLSYSLNGGAERSLQVGPDTRRLHEPGDFNIDIDYAALDGTELDDTVTIIARYGGGITKTHDVTIEYDDGAIWNQNYTIDWSEVTDLQDVVQVVDGKWAVRDGGLRLVEPGYDRFVLLGDESWDFYEVNMSVTMNDLHTVDPRGRDGGVFGFGLWWEGHTDNPVSGWQPKSGWKPSEWIFYYNDDPEGHFELYQRAPDYRYKLQENSTYNFTIRVEQDGPLGRSYSMKVWAEDSPEPASWLFEKTITYDKPTSSAFALLSHYYDVTFNDVAVTEIGGSDIVKGTTGADILRAVDPSAALPGAGELDVFVGRAGADTFVFGEGGKAFYDDGDTASTGLADYGFIWDFETGLDHVRLAGLAEDYVLSENLAGLPTGTAIMLDDGPGELLAVIRGIYGLSLSDGHFLFDSPVA